MNGPFRFAPPPPGAHTRVRLRLLARLRRRWEHRLTLVVGGAGFGKSTVIAQSVAENRIAPEGRDVWLGVDAGDGDGTLGDDLLAAITGRPSNRPPSATSIADAVWELAPLPVCLVLDDAHLVEPESVDHRLMIDLVQSLPANGHLLIAARWGPRLPMARLTAAGELLRVDEPELAFDEDELEALALQRGLDRTELSEAGGWPAMVELLASTGRSVAREFLWQEVIQPLGRDRRRALAAVVELGGGDDTLVSEALGAPVSLDSSLDGVPLITRSEDGWHRPHSLWQPMARLRLGEDERPAVLRRGIRHLLARARFDDAFALIARSELFEEMPALFRASCGGLKWHPPATRLRRWLRAVPPDSASAAPVALAIGVLSSLEEPDHALTPLRAAWRGFEGLDDVEGELVTITHLGRVAWWCGDRAVLGEVAPRLAELAEQGHSVARSLDAIRRAVVADLAGDDRTMIRALSDADQARLGASWAPIIDWMRGVAHYTRGDMEAAATITGTAPDGLEDEAFRPTIEALHRLATWRLGAAINDELGEHDLSTLDAQVSTGATHNLIVGAAAMSLQCSHVGDVEAARRLLDRAQVLEHGDRAVAVVRVATAEASLRVAADDEAGAAEILRDAVDRFPIDVEARRVWREALALSYVLLPDARQEWDRMPLVGFWARSREFASAVVELRKGAPADAVLACFGDLAASVVRVHLHHRFAAELAVAMARAGRAEAPAVLDTLGNAGRARVRALAAVGSGTIQRSARELLSAVPAEPPCTVAINLLGSIAVRRGGTIANDPELRRERVRTLLGYLLTRRSTMRTEVIHALWPELDERAGANNLRVTLNYVQRVIEPWRTEGEPSYFIRAEGPMLRVPRSDYLDVDLDTFDANYEAATRHEHEGNPSEALHRYVAAADLWRGELCCDVADAPWLDEPRARARLRAGVALRRAGELQLARGEPDGAERLGQRALDLDPWDEGAHAVLIGAALARGDRPTARWALDRALATLRDLGVEPGADITRLAATIARDAR